MLFGRRICKYQLKLARSVYVVENDEVKWSYM